MAIFTTMTSLLLKPVMGGEGKPGRRALQLIKGRLDPDHAFLARDEDHAVHPDRHACRPSEPMTSGASAAKGAEPVAWHEWRWTEACRVGECGWQEVRWRLYQNGRIAFHAEMENAAGSIRVGTLQGHRLELRTRDGLLLGAWKAAFVVGRGSGIRHFPATVLDEHPLLPMHFEELAERQSGIFFHG